ncbi:hypothetical protein Slu03_05290 [Sediminihabitans luteus]|uniref:alpha/beta hydrolase family protein n=1 Tax=Sediminihabitans luteus TaxID=1138585 RepID=UPI000C24C5C7|nr:alpha/beta hydrolase [Sediminihabitans luteus]GII98151.1 hypothetical protein Slu03_05290 [Sediminihabitans luteus]
MIFRTAATSAVLAILLAIVGAVLGPQWDPAPMTDHVEVASASTVIGDAASYRATGPVDAGDAAPRADVGTYDVRTTVLTVELDGTSVDAVLREPVRDADETTLLPGVVFLHGAGTGDARTAFASTATALASAGVVTLVPSKRLDTYSTRHRDYVTMAADYDRSVAVLRGAPGVDPRRVGLYAESEGAWIAPVITATDPSVAFLVLASAPVVPPREQAAFAVDNYLHNTGVPQELYRVIPRAVGMALPGGGFEYADFDVEPSLRRTGGPVLMLYGTADASMPIEQGAQIVLAQAGAEVDGGAQVTVRYYDGADHGLRVDGTVVPEVPRDVGAWVEGLPAVADAAPQVAGAQPFQRSLAGPVPTPRWLASGDLMLALILVAAALMVVGSLALVVVVLRARAVRRAGGVPRTVVRRSRAVPLVVLTLATVASFVALIAYLVTVARLALGYARDPWLVEGGWLAVRALGVVAIVAAAVLVNRALESRSRRRATLDDTPVAAWRARPDAAVQGVLGHACVVVLVGGAVLLLVVLAYWGVFQLGI